MGPANSKIEPLEGLKLPDRKKQKRSTSTDDEDGRGSGSNDDDESPTSLALRRLETARDTVYTNGDLFNQIASFSTVQDLNSFAEANKETKQAVCKSLSHWKCSDECCRCDLFGDVDDLDTVLSATCDFCQDHFCGKCLSKCSDCGVVSCYGCFAVCRCSVHEVFHCKDCDFTRLCDVCMKGHYRDSDVDTQFCDRCRLWLCTNCTVFDMCSCGKRICFECVGDGDWIHAQYHVNLEFCDNCELVFCEECSPGNLETCLICDEKFCSDCRGVHDD